MPDPIILIGNGTFSPGGSGYASAPRKKVIRNLATKFPVFITNECYTSKKCPISFNDVTDVKEKDNKTKSSGDRLRKYATINEDTAAESAEESSSDSDIQDRDCIGSININQKGIYNLLGNPITHFECCS